MQIGQRLQNGDPHREIAESYGVSEDSVQRHKRHLGAALVNAENTTLAQQWNTIFSRADELFKSMSVQGDARACLMALDQQAKALEASARFAKEIREREAAEELPPEKRPVTIESLDAILNESERWYEEHAHMKTCPTCHQRVSPINNTFDECGVAIVPQPPQERKKPN